MRHGALRFVVAAAVALLAVAVPATLPLAEHETVRQYLENGGHEFLRKHLGYGEDVVYNPLIHVQRDDVRGADAQGRPALSDVQALRELGYFVPGIDDDSLVTSGRVLKMHTVARQSFDVLVRGTKSVFEVSYRGSPPVQARQAFSYALQVWANTFPCNVRLRVLFNWNYEAGSRTLAAAVSPFSILKRDVGGSGLRPDAAYTPTMAAAVSGRDYIPQRFHIEIIFNGAQRWHYHTDRGALRPFYDFATVAIHEACHGLYFTGALLANMQQGKAEFRSIDSFPGRFDQFIQMSNGVGIARSCNDRQRYRSLTTRGLMFRSTVQANTFMLYAPESYRPGSSTYHFDNLGLIKDCERQGIAKKDCSNLMTFELDPGYTQHSIGEPALRVMRTVLNNSRGLVKSECVIPAPLAGSETEKPTVGLLDQTADIGPFKVPVWVIGVAGVLAAVGAAIVVFFIVTAFARR